MAVTPDQVLNWLVLLIKHRSVEHPLLAVCP
jgi:hypothetical protein